MPIDNAEQQKNMLLNALGGFGFEAKKVVESKPVTGIIYGPDEATYYAVVEQGKKKKNNVKGFLGVSQIDKMVFFVLDTNVNDFLWNS